MALGRDFLKSFHRNDFAALRAAGNHSSSMVPGGFDVPHTYVPITVPHELAAGWLVFVCGVERRRYSPVPDQWESMSAAELRVYLGLARGVESYQTRLPRPPGA